MYFVNVNQIIDLGRFEMGIVSKIKDFDNAPSELVQEGNRGDFNKNQLDKL